MRQPGSRCWWLSWRRPQSWPLRSGRSRHSRSVALTSIPRQRRLRAARSGARPRARHLVALPRRSEVAVLAFDDQSRVVCRERACGRSVASGWHASRWAALHALHDALYDASAMCATLGRAQGDRPHHGRRGREQRAQPRGWPPRRDGRADSRLRDRGGGASPGTRAPADRQADRGRVHRGREGPARIWPPSSRPFRGSRRGRQRHRPHRQRSAAAAAPGRKTPPATPPRAGGADPRAPGARSGSRWPHRRPAALALVVVACVRSAVSDLPECERPLPADATIARSAPAPYAPAQPEKPPLREPPELSATSSPA